MRGLLKRKFLLPLLALLCAAGLLTGCADINSLLDEVYSQDVQVDKQIGGQQEEQADSDDLAALARQAEDIVEASGSYSAPAEVAAYLHVYDKLPSNYITKKEAEALGWVSSKGNLWDVAEGMSIGGDRFGNYEKQLPVQSGRRYFECDVNYNGGYRDAQRLIYSNDGYIYYTEDHYETFEQIYP